MSRFDFPRDRPLRIAFVDGDPPAHLLRFRCRFGPVPEELEPDGPPPPVFTYVTADGRRRGLYLAASEGAVRCPFPHHPPSQGRGGK